MKNFLCLIILCALPISKAADLSQSDHATILNFKPVAGIHYREIKQTLAVSKDSIIFLWYGCKSCLQLDKQFAKNNPNWQRIPISLYKSWRPQTKLFYTLRSLKLDSASDIKLMSALDNGAIDIDDLDAQINQILTSAITEKDVDDIYYSKAINQQVAFSDTLARQLSIKHVPAALIAGKYYLDLAMVANLQQFVDSIHYLEQFSKLQSTPSTGAK